MSLLNTLLLLQPVLLAAHCTAPAPALAPLYTELAQFTEQRAGRWAAEWAERREETTVPRDSQIVEEVLDSLRQVVQAVNTENFSPAAVNEIFNGIIGRVFK